MGSSASENINKKQTKPTTNTHKAFRFKVFRHFGSSVFALLSFVPAVTCAQARLGSGRCVRMRRSGQGGLSAASGLCFVLLDCRGRASCRAIHLIGRGPTFIQASSLHNKAEYCTTVGAKTADSVDIRSVAPKAVLQGYEKSRRVYNKSEKAKYVPSLGLHTGR